MSRVIIVLGNSDEYVYRKRVDAAVKHIQKQTMSYVDPDSLQSKPISFLLMSGGGGGKINEAERMSNYATSLGINPKNIIIEGKSLNTVQNILFSRKILAQMFPPGLGAVIETTICTSSFHLPRAGLIASYLLPGHRLRLLGTDEMVTQEQSRREAISCSRVFQHFGMNIENFNRTRVEAEAELANPFR